MSQWRPVLGWEDWVRSVHDRATNEGNNDANSWQHARQHFFLVAMSTNECVFVTDGDEGIDLSSAVVHSLLSHLRLTSTSLNWSITTLGHPLTRQSFLSLEPTPEICFEQLKAALSKSVATSSLYTDLTTTLANLLVQFDWSSPRDSRCCRQVYILFPASYFLTDDSNALNSIFKSNLLKEVNRRQVQIHFVLNEDSKSTMVRKFYCTNIFVRILIL